MNVNTFHKLILFLSFWGLASCLNSSQQDLGSNSVTKIESTSTHDLENYDVEEIAEAYAEVDIPINHLTSNGLLPPNDGKYGKQEHIKELLRGLLNGPCVKNADQIFEKLLKAIQERIDDLSEKLLKEKDPKKADILSKRIELLENLEEKIQIKKDECAKGISQCSDKFVEKLKKAIAEVQKVINQLQERISDETDNRKLAVLNRLLERAQKEKEKLKKILSHCD